MSVKLNGFIGLSLVVISVVVINFFSYNQNPKIYKMTANNSFELYIGSSAISECQLVNFIEQNKGGELVFNCPVSTLISSKQENANLIVNSKSYTCADEDLEYDLTHVFKCYISSLSDLNGFG